MRAIDRAAARTWTSRSIASRLSGRFTAVCSGANPAPQNKRTHKQTNNRPFGPSLRSQRRRRLSAGYRHATARGTHEYCPRRIAHGGTHGGTHGVLLGVLTHRCGRARRGRSAPRTCRSSGRGTPPSASLRTNTHTHTETHNHTNLPVGVPAWVGSRTSQP